jgi:hypothetical protein
MTRKNEPIFIITIRGLHVFSESSHISLPPLAHLVQGRNWTRRKLCSQRRDRNQERLETERDALTRTFRPQVITYPPGQAPADAKISKVKLLRTERSIDGVFAQPFEC